MVSKKPQTGRYQRFERSRHVDIVMHYASKYLNAKPTHTHWNIAAFVCDAMFPRFHCAEAFGIGTTERKKVTK